MNYLDCDCADCDLAPALSASAPFYDLKCDKRNGIVTSWCMFLVMNCFGNFGMSILPLQFETRLDCVQVLVAYTFMKVTQSGIQYMPGVKPLVIVTLCTVMQLCLPLLCPIGTETSLPHTVQPLPSGLRVSRGRFLLIQDVLVHNPSHHEGGSLRLLLLRRVCHRGLSVGPLTRFWLGPGSFG